MNVSSERMQLILQARFSHLVRLSTFFEDAVYSLAAVEIGIEIDRLVGDLSLATHELCANIIDHAYNGEGDNSIEVTLHVHPAHRQIEVMLADNGRTYNPQELTWPPPQSWRKLVSGNQVKYCLESVPMPDFEQDRGRGLFLISQLVNSLSYFSQGPINYWCLVKKF